MPLFLTARGRWRSRSELIPRSVRWLCGPAQEHEEIGAGESSAVSVELSLRPNADVLRECAIRSRCFSHVGKVPIQQIQHLIGKASEVPILSAVSEPWVVDAGSGFDLIGAEKVGGCKLRPCPFD